MGKVSTEDLIKLNEAEGFLGLGDWQSANEVLETLTPKVRASYEALCIRCRIYGKARRWDLVQPVAETLAEQFPDEWKPSYFLAQCFAQPADFKTAREHLEYAINHPADDLRQLALDHPALDEFWLHVEEA